MGQSGIYGRRIKRNYMEWGSPGIYGTRKRNYMESGIYGTYKLGMGSRDWNAYKQIWNATSGIWNRIKGIIWNGTLAV
ncbi:hypothetical protein CEXT_29021 [Caerostris extrusa]|uniref:Uncharacterized protein n=1 Tax=Caerostris extrusa TaxID=172846 RepID=A0AAV4U0V2_CAEEX|nr:hypothetical protein CEXT_29021 [Caerostris extrusa]